MDGNHKMIRWRLIIHAGVDGFSRLITYIKCANNNLASTVLEEFLKGAQFMAYPIQLEQTVVVKMLMFGDACYQHTKIHLVF